MTTPTPLTYEEILTLTPGDPITIAGQAWDGSLWSKPAVVLTKPEPYGYYQVGGLGTWSLYNTPTPFGETWLPSAKVTYRHHKKRAAFELRSSDVRHVYRGWVTPLWESAQVTRDGPEGEG